MKMSVHQKKQFQEDLQNFNSSQHFLEQNTTCHINSKSGKPIA